MRSIRLQNLLAVVLAVLSACALNAQADSLQVLHWWISISEHKSVDLLAASLAEENIQWTESLIPSGSGGGALIVLKSRVLAGDAPEAAQLNGTILGDWANLGLLLDLDSVAAAGKWDKLLFPSISAWIRPKGHVVAVPLGIHRINTLFYNRKLLNQYGLTPPQNWTEFEQVAAKLQKAGVPALAQSSEPWQVATLFETLVLAESGPGFYRDLFVKKNPAAFADPKFANALTRLRSLKQWMLTPIQEQSWPEVAKEFSHGAAAMMVMGDWAKGELNAWGFATDGIFGCVAVPGTDAYHLYDIDTLAMFSGTHSHRPAQQKLAEAIMSNAMQNDYNQIKGSIPAIRNPELAKMDSCSRASWKVFSRGENWQAPSLAHRMATDETSRDAIINEVQRYFLNDQITVQETQRRLASISHILIKLSPHNDAQNSYR